MYQGWKAVDEKWLKEARAAKAKAAKEGIEELVAMEVEAEARETEAWAFKPRPVHPCDQPHNKGAGDHWKVQSKCDGEFIKGSNGVAHRCTSPSRLMHSAG